MIGRQVRISTGVEEIASPVVIGPAAVQNSRVALALRKDSAEVAIFLIETAS